MSGCESSSFVIKPLEHTLTKWELFINITLTLAHSKSLNVLADIIRGLSSFFFFEKSDVSSYQIGRSIIAQYFEGCVCSTLFLLIAACHFVLNHQNIEFWAHHLLKWCVVDGKSGKLLSTWAIRLTQYV